jgi:RNA polymerase sigma-70 factor (ECF subfamily)
MDFWEIYDSYYPRVVHYATSMLHDRSAADDVVQETFIRVQKNLATVREPEKIPAWVFRVAHNLCIDHLRAQESSRIETGAEPDAMCSSGNTVSVDTDLEHKEMSSCVREKIERLPENHRAIILLSDIMELSQQEIADILGIEVGAVKVRLHRARTKLRAILKDDCSFTRDERNVLVCEPTGDRKR